MTWAEQLEVLKPDVEAIGRYQPVNGWLDGKPVVVSRRIGAGSITYIGADLDESGLKAARTALIERAGLQAVLPGIPDDVDVSIRQASDRRVLILIRTNGSASAIPLPRPMRDLLTGETVSTVALGSLGVAVLEDKP